MKNIFQLAVLTIAIALQGAYAYADAVWVGQNSDYKADWNTTGKWVDSDTKTAVSSLSGQTCWIQSTGNYTNDQSAQEIVIKNVNSSFDGAALYIGFNNSKSIDGINYDYTSVQKRFSIGVATGGGGEVHMGYAFLNPRENTVTSTYTGNLIIEPDPNTDNNFRTSFENASGGSNRILHVSGNVEVKSGAKLLIKSAAVANGVDTMEISGNYTGSGKVRLEALETGASTEIYSNICVSGANSAFEGDWIIKTASGSKIISGKGTAETGLGGASVTIETGNLEIANTQTIKNLSSVAGAAAATSITGGASTLTLEMGNGVSNTYYGTLGGGLSVVKTGAGTLTLNQTNTYSGTTTINGGVLNLTASQTFNDLSGDAGTSITGAAGVTLTANMTADKTMAGTVDGGLSLVKTGAGTLTLTAKNTFTGDITVSNGTLTMTYGQKSPYQNLLGQVTVSGANSILHLQANMVLQGYQSPINVSDGGKIIVNGYQYFNTLALDNGSITGSEIRFGNIADSKITVTGTQRSSIDAIQLVKKSGESNTTTLTVEVAPTASLSINGVVDFNDVNYKGASIKKTGAGALTLSGTVNYIGTTTISAGTLELTGTTNLNNSASITNNGAITAASAQTFNNLSGTASAASIVLSSGDLTLFNTDATTSKYLGKINVGTRKIIKTGTGTLQLHGVAADDITADTLVVDFGRLDLKDYLTGSLEVNANGAFSPGNSVGTAYVNNFSLAGDLIMEVESASSFDILNIAGTANYTDGSSIILDLYVPNGAETLNLTMINYTNVATGTENWTIGQNGQYWENLNFANGVLSASAVVTAVPEPSTWALLILGALGLLGLRRKK